MSWVGEKISTVVAVAGIVILEGIALYQGIDGQAFSIVIGILGTIAGVIAGVSYPREKKE